MRRRQNCLVLTVLLIGLMFGLKEIACAKEGTNKFFGTIRITCYADSLEVFRWGSMGHIRGIRQKIVGDRMYLYVKFSSFSRGGILPDPKPFNNHIEIPEKVNQVFLNREKEAVWDRHLDSNDATEPESK